MEKKMLNEYERNERLFYLLMNLNKWLSKLFFIEIYFTYNIHVKLNLYLHLN